MSTFGSFNTALSALRYNRTVLDTASGNIANATTPGYSRRRVEAESVGAAPQPALWATQTTSGDGVRVSGIERMNDPWLDARSRTEHGAQSYLDVRQTALQAVEAGVGEPSESGLAAALAELRQSWHGLANDPGGQVPRNLVLSQATAVTEALGTQVRVHDAETADQRTRVQSAVSEVNTLVSELTTVNRGLAAAQSNQLDAGSLQDRRDAIALRLSELTGSKATANAAGGLDIEVNGVALVTGTIGGQLVVSSGITPTGEADGSPVTFAVVHPTNGVTAVPSGFQGEIGGHTELLNVTLPGHLSRLDDVARTLADTVNAQLSAGYDASGAAGGPLFSYDPSRPAASMAVAITDPDLLAASSQPGGLAEGGNAAALAELRGAEKSYQLLVGDFATTVASAQRLAANQQVLTNQVDASREQLAGVSLDEEMLTMVTAQRGYEAASQVMTVLDSMLDTLINRTGLLR